MPSVSPSELAGMTRLLRKAGGELTVTVDGSSMLPLFAGPVRLRVACGGVVEHRPGAIVLFTAAAGANLVVHRVIAVSRDGRYLITRGDNNLAIDRPVWVHSVLGVVMGFADQDAAQGWDNGPPRPAGLLWRAAIAAARTHYFLAFGLASASIAVQWAVRRIPRP